MISNRLYTNKVGPNKDKVSSFNSMVGILGPACSDTVEPIAGVSRFFKTVVITYSAEGSLQGSSDNRGTANQTSKYPYFFRTIAENRQYK